MNTIFSQETIETIKKTYIDSGCRDTFTQRQQVVMKKIAESHGFYNLKIFVFESQEGVYFTSIQSDKCYVLPYPFDTGFWAKIEDFGWIKL